MPPDAGSGHDHGDSPDHDHSHGATGVVGRLIGRLRDLAPHDHGPPELPADTGAAGIRATKVSLVALAATAAVQAVVVAFTGSVALLSDTIHNLTDALTAVPLWIAFALGRRPATKRFTYGYHRAEDFAGLLIMVAIAFSAGAVAWESFGRFFDPRDLQHVPWVIAAGLVGAAGNEVVARYRMKVGRQIGSEALVSDGHHARTDALTSLAVVAAGIGAALDQRWADPVAGLAVAVMILVLMRHSAGRMFGRLLDAVDPELVERAVAAAESVPGVAEVRGLQLRWQGHRLSSTLTVAVDPHLSVRQGHDIASEVRRRIFETFPYNVNALVHVDPADETAH